MLARIVAPAAAGLRGQFIHEPPAGVVPRARVLTPGVAEADDEFERKPRHDTTPIKRPVSKPSEAGIYQGVLDQVRIFDN
jgi:hypothetical protein